MNEHDYVCDRCGADYKKCIHYTEDDYSLVPRWVYERDRFHVNCICVLILGLAALCGWILGH